MRKGFREEVLIIIELGFGRWVGLAYICVALGILQNILVTGGSLSYNWTLFWAPVGWRSSWNTSGRTERRDLVLPQAQEARELK